MEWRVCSLTPGKISTSLEEPMGKLLCFLGGMLTGAMALGAVAYLAHTHANKNIGDTNHDEQVAPDEGIATEVRVAG